jgi:hypothetical protein
MRSLEFCEHFPPFGGRSGASSDPRWARRLIENFAQEGGQGGLPLTPSFFGIYFNLIRSYRNRGDARATGAEARKAGAPRSDCLFL